MQKLALGALVALSVACSGNSDNKVHIVTDSGSGGSDTACNPLTQTGCATGEKCTWIYDLVSADATNILGHVGCAPEGDKAVGDQCTRNAAGAEGWDDCTKDGFCKAKRELIGPGGVGVCEQVCDNNGGDPTCAADASCVAYHNIFEDSGMNVAGVCDKKCDPFADNDPLHTGSGAPTRPGTQCQAYEGCYGYPSSKPQTPTSYSCAREYNTDLHHRDECTDTSGNSLSSANPLSQVACATASNGCSEGYMALYYEMTGSMVVVCTAMCKPADCYAGNCGSNSANLTGDPAGRQCIPAQIAGTPVPATTGSNGVNGDQCVFNWRYEIDTTGNWAMSPYSDTAGWCFQHQLYLYDVNGDMMYDSNDAAPPKCDTFTDPSFGTGSAVGGQCLESNGCIGAATFGCTSSTTSGLAAFQHKKIPNLDRLPLVRPPYNTARM